MSKFKSNKKGMMLLEVLLAILILSIGITTSIKALQNIMLVSKYSYAFFETYFISSDILFSIMTCTDKPGELMNSSVKQKIEANSKYQFAYRHDYKAYEIVSDIDSDSDLEASSLGVKLTQAKDDIKYLKGQTTIFLDEQPFFLFDCFQDFKESELR